MEAGFDVGLVAIVYCGVVVSAISNYLRIWVIDKSSPVFLAMTVPLILVITIILSLLIGEAVTLGRFISSALLFRQRRTAPILFLEISFLMHNVISGALMVGGLYYVLWGMRIEQVAVSKQGGNGKNAACLDLEEQERAAPVPATQDLIKSVYVKEKTDATN